jgi:uncharacterized protein (DUF488 family)
MNRKIWTIGHSSHELAELLSILAAYGIEAIADVRRFPGSKRHPQFGRAALEASLQAQGLRYVWLPELGGRRTARPDSPNYAWRDAAFRGYADHMATEEFERGLTALIELASTQRTAIMCAELLWWRCHRALIADALKARGFEVIHIQSVNQSLEHPFTEPARIVDGKLTYRPDGQLF